jgi:parallel beta-helix repeat protein
MVFRLLITLILIIFLYSLSSATIINIPADYPTIQQGIDASVDGDTVLVQPGTYVENIDFNSHTITLASLFLTTQDTSYISSTIIDGDSSGSVVTIVDGGGTITGFTIQNGYAIDGGGFKNYGHENVHTISNNIIRGNTATSAGGGIRAAGSIIINNTIYGNSARLGGGIHYNWGHRSISDNVITGNSALIGGGIWMRTSSPEVNNNIISGNTASSLGGGFYSGNSFSTITDNIFYENQALYGGGIYSNDSELTFSNNIVEANIAENNGGGIYIDNDNPAINNNLIIGNIANNNGGGINIYGARGTMIYNNTISANSAAIKGGGIYSYNDFDSSFVFNTIIWGNSALHGDEVYLEESELLIITYCDIQGGWGGEGNIHLDPLFVDPQNGDYHLWEGSPCIDAGDPDSPYDPDGTICDMGAFYFDQTTGIDDVLKSNTFSLSQNYPNPFNAQTTIRFIIPEPQNVHLTVYDLLGRRVEMILDEHRQAGVHSVTFDASDLSSGVYFYRLEAGDRVETKRMLLLK